MVVPHSIMRGRIQGTVRVTTICVRLPSLPAARSASAASHSQHMYAAAWLPLMQSRLYKIDCIDAAIHTGKPAWCSAHNGLVLKAMHGTAACTMPQRPLHSFASCFVQACRRTTKTSSATPRSGHATRRTPPVRRMPTQLPCARPREAAL